MKKLNSKHLQYYKKLFPFIKMNIRLSIHLFVIKFILLIVGLLPPLIYKYYIDQVITNKQLSKVLNVVIGYVLLYVVQSIFLILNRYIETKSINRVRISLKQSLLEIYSSMDFSDYEREDIGDIRMRIESDTNAICNFYINHCLNYIFAIMYSAIVIIILFHMNWYLNIFSCLMIIFSYFITTVLGDRIKKISEKYRLNQSGFDTAMHDVLQNWKEIKINNLEDRETKLLSERWLGLSEMLLKRTRYQFLHGALVAFNLFFVTRMNLYFFGGLLIIKELMTVPTMLIFMNYFEQLYSNIQTILNSTVSLSGEIPQIDRVLSTLDYAKQSEQTTEMWDIKQLQGDIRLENVCFRYHNSKHANLNNITTTINHNSSLAIVGASGSGKTTLVKLLVGLYQPVKGTIYLNDIDMTKIPHDTKSHYINIVMQNPQFFNMSILENLLLAKPDASMEEIDNACKKANIYDYIQMIPDKYDTLIGERGIKLSGGQKQRLAIARTLLLDPQILIFDEATSSLDSENEAAIVNAIYNLSKYKTIITISHRFSTISKSENIILIQDGRILEQGKLSTVINESELFATIFNKENILIKY